MIDGSSRRCSQIETNGRALWTTGQSYPPVMNCSRTGGAVGLSAGSGGRDGLEEDAGAVQPVVEAAVAGCGRGEQDHAAGRGVLAAQPDGLRQLLGEQGVYAGQALEGAEDEFAAVRDADQGRLDLV